MQGLQFSTMVIPLQLPGMARKDKPLRISVAVFPPISRLLPQPKSLPALMLKPPLPRSLISFQPGLLWG